MLGNRAVVYAEFPNRLVDRACAATLACPVQPILEIRPFMDPGNNAVLITQKSVIYGI